jgi:hypothetical protein
MGPVAGACGGGRRWGRRVRCTRRWGVVAVRLPRARPVASRRHAPHTRPGGRGRDLGGARLPRRDGGWVGCTTVPRGCLGGRPRRGGTPVCGRARRCRVPAPLSGGAESPHRPPPRAACRPGQTAIGLPGEQRPRCRADQLLVPVPRNPPGFLPGRGGCGSGPPDSPWAPGSDGLVENRRAPCRGRPSTQPRGTVVRPSRPPTRGDGSTGRAGPARGRRREVGPGRAVGYSAPTAADPPGRECPHHRAEEYDR